MKFDDYQKRAILTDVYGGRGDVTSQAFVNKLLGLVGETGEIAEKVKKIHRNNAGVMSAKQRQELAKELGDVLWYLSAIAHYLDCSLGDIAQQNLDKLIDRKNRGVLKASGDNR